MPFFPGIETLKQWHTSPGPLAAGLAIANNSLYLAPLDDELESFRGNMLANTFGIAVSVNHATGSTQSRWTSTARIGLYTRSGSTLSLVNSGTMTFGRSAGASSTSNTWTSSFNGARIMEFSSAQWSSAPYFLDGRAYWIAIGVATNAFNGPMSLMSAGAAISTAAMSGGLGVGGASVSSQNQWAIFRGAYSVTTAGIPASIAMSDVVASAGTGIVYPWIRLDVDGRNYA
jgi:hypothetical protein